MFIDFLTVLLLLTIAFWLLAMVAGPTILIPLFLIDRSPHGLARAITLGQVVQAVLFSALLALGTTTYTAGQVLHTWPFGLAAFLSTYFVLSSHAYETGQQPSGLRSKVQSTDRAAVYRGAVLGSIMGLASFAIVYVWPDTINSIPGMSALVSAIIRVAESISGYWITRIILLLLAIGYVYKVGLVAVLTTVVALSSLLRRIRAIF